MGPQFTILAALASLSLFSGSAVSQINYASCSLSLYNWTYNSLSQNACAVSAYLQGTCNQGVFSQGPLGAGEEYTGPAGVDNSNLCKCNTITYSLVSACGACQGANWITWSEWVTNCTTVLPISSFPNPVPSGTYVPQWALLDVSLENSWNPNKSMSTGDSPEISPGALIGTSSTSSGTSTRTAVPAGSTSSNPTASPTSKGKSSNTGPIVGGIVGGIAVIGAAVLGIFYLRRRRTGPAYAPPSEGAPPSPFDGELRPRKGYMMGQSDDGTHTSSLPPASPMRVYNPNDPTTFPNVQAASYATHDPVYGSQEGVGNTSATTQVPRPQGYHGLPLV